MPVHRVQQGEFVAKIAARYGVSPDAVWNHPDNADLKGRRGTPHVLKQGDRLVIPERDLKTEAAATGKTHTFRVASRRTRVKVRFHLEDEARSAISYAATIEGRVVEGTLDGEGAIEVSVPIDAESFDVELRPAGEPAERYHVLVGHLDPADDDAGALQRLEHLGYAWDCGGAADGFGGEGARVLAGFQRKHGLEATGRLDQATRDELRKAHGS